MYKIVKKFVSIIIVFFAVVCMVACGGGSSKKYAVQFSSNGGSGGPIGIQVTYGKPLPDLSEESLPTNAGLHFAGYYDAQTGGEIYYANDLTPAKGKWDKKEHGVLYARWTSTPEFIIIFHKNDGKNETVTQTVQMNSNITLKENEFERSKSYTFLGWALTQKAAGAEYLDKANCLSGASNVNLYAVWTSARVATITFHKNDGSGDKAIQSMPQNTTANLALNPFARDGLALAGWSDTSTGNVVYADTEEIIIGTSPMNLYAIWTVATYTIRYDKNHNDATGTMDDSTHTYNVDKVLTVNGYTCTYYVFIGWNTQADGSGTDYIDAQNVKNLTANAGAVVTLYAKWWKMFDMVRINAGTFTMGSNDTQDYGAQPAHQVTLTQGFYMGKYQVTQKEYLQVMGTNPSYFSNNPTAGEVQELRPVEQVSWYDALVFCNKLSVMEGLTPAYSINGSTDTNTWGTVPTSSNSIWNSVQIVAGSTGYRLPTEAQWEYACRAGTTTAYNTGDTISNDTGWYTSNSNSRTHQVGLKPANAWGLYDMHGNVYEWCWDWYGTYASGPQTDPVGVSSGSVRLCRGGGWPGSSRNLRSAYRNYFTPSYRNSGVGFRVVRL